MQVSSRARLAWANRNLEEAADIIIADYLRGLTEFMGTDSYDGGDVQFLADDMDPDGSPEFDLSDIDLGCGDSYCHICGDPGDLFDDLEDED